jgi:hypothetical protein
MRKTDGGLTCREHLPESGKTCSEVFQDNLQSAQCLRLLQARDRRLLARPFEGPLPFPLPPLTVSARFFHGLLAGPPAIPFHALPHTQKKAWFEHADYPFKDSEGKKKKRKSRRRKGNIMV